MIKPDPVNTRTGNNRAHLKACHAHWTHNSTIHSPSSISVQLSSVSVTAWGCILEHIASVKKQNITKTPKFWAILDITDRVMFTVRKVLVCLHTRRLFTVSQTVVFMSRVPRVGSLLRPSQVVGVPFPLFPWIKLACSHVPHKSKMCFYVPCSPIVSVPLFPFGLNILF